MTDTRNQVRSDDIWYEAEERAHWLLRINGGRIAFGITEYRDVDSLTKIIYDRELALREAGEKSLFERENVIPNKDLPEE